MAAISKLINVMLGVVLGLTLSNGAIAAVSGGSDCAEGKGGRPDLLKCDQEIRQGVETVRGDVLRVEYDNLIIQRSDGHEVHLQFDENTEMTGYIGPGEHIEAKVNEQKHVLSVRQLQ